MDEEKLDRERLVRALEKISDGVAESEEYELIVDANDLVNAIHFEATNLLNVCFCSIRPSSSSIPKGFPNWSPLA